MDGYSRLGVKKHEFLSRVMSRVRHPFLLMKRRDILLSAAFKIPLTQRTEKRDLGVPPPLPTHTALINIKIIMKNVI